MEIITTTHYSDYDMAILDGATPEQAAEYEYWVEENPDLHQGEPYFKKWIDSEYDILEYEKFKDAVFYEHLEIYESILRLELVEQIKNENQTNDVEHDELFDIHLDTHLKI